MWKVNRFGNTIWEDGRKGQNITDDFRRMVMESKIERQEKVNYAFDLLKQDYSFVEAQRILEEKLGAKPYAARNYLRDAYKKIDAYLDREYNVVVATHLARYEKIYKEAITTITTLKEDNVELFGKIAPAKYMEALEAMYGKERLIGLHDKAIEVDVTNTNIHFKQKPSEFQLSRLTDSEKDELLTLLRESRVGEIDGIYPTIKKQRTLDVVWSNEEDDSSMDGKIETPKSIIEDIQHEVIDLPKKEQTIEELRDQRNKKYNEITNMIHEEDQNVFRELLRTRKEKKDE